MCPQKHPVSVRKLLYQNIRPAPSIASSTATGLYRHRKGYSTTRICREGCYQPLLHKPSSCIRSPDGVPGKGNSRHSSPLSPKANAKPSFSLYLTLPPPSQCCDTNAILAEHNPEIHRRVSTKSAPREPSPGTRVDHKPRHHKFRPMRHHPWPPPP